MSGSSFSCHNAVRVMEHARPSSHARCRSSATCHVLEEERATVTGNQVEYRMVPVRARVSEKNYVIRSLPICGVIESLFVRVSGGRCHPLEPSGDTNFSFPRLQPASFVILPLSGLRHFLRLSREEPHVERSSGGSRRCTTWGVDGHLAWR